MAITDWDAYYSMSGGEEPEYVSGEVCVAEQPARLSLRERQWNAKLDRESRGLPPTAGSNHRNGSDSVSSVTVILKSSALATDGYAAAPICARHRLAFVICGCDRIV